MSADGDDKKSSEIIIIRRSGHGEEGGHHGGVWKIAYADFMTAMMAFFLVMWLINSTDKKTLTQVATYFNPLRLTDKVPANKGLHQSETGAQSEDQTTVDPKRPLGPAKTESKAQGQGESEGVKSKQAEEAIFRDPYALLAKLAKQADEEQRRLDAAGGQEAYKDPFEPAIRRSPKPDAQAPDTKKAPELAAGARDSAPKPSPGQQTLDLKGTEEGAAALKPGESQPVGKVPLAARSPETAHAAEAAKAPDAGKAPDAAKVTEAGKAPEAAKTPEAGKAPEAGKVAEAAKAANLRAERAATERAAAERLEAAIKQAISQPRSVALPHIEVKATEEGMLISLTDDYDFGMFAIASAEPRPAMVVIMEKLAKVLAGQPERLVVRGHTDGRPYKTGAYDNWRLSTARAHMAYYMLVRGGIDEKRFERVEGHADRALRIADEPEAAQNRRIEILLRKGKP